jgi:hypothetical protein
MTCRFTHNLETRRLGQCQLIWYWSFFILSVSRQVFQISRDFLPLPSLWTRNSHLCEGIEFTCTTSGKSRYNTRSSSWIVQESAKKRADHSIRHIGS